MVTMRIFTFKKKSPGIEPGTSESVVRNSDHEAGAGKKVT
jgi:hypothetical protein